MGVATLERLRRRFVGEGLGASLRERPRPGARPKLGPKEQAFVVALACTEPHDPARPVVCFDETNKQLIAETRTPLPMAPGRPERVDYEYERKGTANLFLVTQPRGAWRHVDVTDRRTKHDFARQMRDLVDRHFPDAATIRVVLDNLP
jgi:hypothetical protein